MLRFNLYLKNKLILFLNLCFCPFIFGENSFRELSSSPNRTEYVAEFYSYAGRLGIPDSTHTFARFVKIVNGKPTEKVDISWLPNEKNLRIGGRMPLFTSVRGKNYTFEETQVLAGNKPIFSHGKFLIDEVLFDRAKARKTFLNSGKVPYRFLGTSDSDDGINCIHALLGVVGNTLTGTKNGETGTDAVIDYFLSMKGMRRIFPNERGSGDLTNTSLPLSHSAQVFSGVLDLHVRLASQRQERATGTHASSQPSQRLNLQASTDEMIQEEKRLLRFLRRPIVRDR